MERRRFLHLTGVTIGTGTVLGTAGADEADGDTADGADFVYPTTGTLYRGSDLLDYPILIDGAEGSSEPIYPARSGTVTSIGTKEKCEHHVVIKHGDTGYDTRYCFEGRVAVNEGDSVETHQSIGTMEGRWGGTVNFGIFRDGTGLSVPGGGEVPVTAGDPIPKDYPGIGSTLRPVPPKLKEEKLALATRLENITEGTIREKSHVETVMENLNASVADGSIPSTEAENTVRRLKLGEEVTERTLVGAGPAEPDVGGGQDYNILTSVMEMILNTGISTMLGLLPFGRLLEKIPFGIGDKVVRTVNSWGRKIMKLLMKPLRATVLNRRARTQINETSRDLYGHAGTVGAKKLHAEMKEKVNNLASTLGSFFLDQGLEQSLHDDLSEFNATADPLAAGSFIGSFDGAKRAAEQGIAAANQLLEDANNDLETFDEITSGTAAQIVKTTVDLVAVAGILAGGIFGLITELVGKIITIGEALYGWITAKSVSQSVNRLGRNHEQTLDNIAASTPN